MKINLALFLPDNYNHSKVFEEVILYYLSHLKDLGYSTLYSVNNLIPGYLNIILGYQFLPWSKDLEDISYIIIQLEQLSFDAGWFGGKKERFFSEILPLFKNALQIWDYSKENIEFMEQFNLKPYLIPFGFHQKLKLINPSSHKNIDVLFYGSLQKRRSEIIKELENHCNIKTIFRLYGKGRDKIIRHCKIILNIHAFENLKILEQVRLFYLLNNKCFVISEESISNPYEDAIISLPYGKLVSGVLEWLKKDKEREIISEKGLQTLKKLDVETLIREALENITLKIE